MGSREGNIADKATTSLRWDFLPRCRLSMRCKCMGYTTLDSAQSSAHGNSSFFGNHCGREHKSWPEQPQREFSLVLNKLFKFEAIFASSDFQKSI